MDFPSVFFSVTIEGRWYLSFNIQTWKLRYQMKNIIIITRNSDLIIIICVLNNTTEQMDAIQIK